MGFAGTAIGSTRADRIESSPEGETRCDHGELSKNEGAHAHAGETTLGRAEVKKNVQTLLCP